MDARAGVSHPGLFRTVNFSIPTPRPEKISRRIAPASTFRCSDDSAAARIRARIESSETM